MRAWGPGRESGLGDIGRGWDMPKKIWPIWFAVGEDGGDGVGGGKMPKEKKAVR